MALLKLEDKVVVCFDKKSIQITTHCTMEEILVAILTKQDRRIYNSVMGTSLLEQGIFGNIKPLNHSFSKYQQEHGAPAMKRIILDEDWNVSGFNYVMDGKMHVNHHQDQDGNNVESLVMVLDNVVPFS